jgi:hypothetical protein
MRFVRSRALRALVLIMVSAAAQALPPDTVLDEERKAAAGTAAALYAGRNLTADLGRLSGGASNIADRTLRLLDAATTPAALLGKPHGLTVACPLGGSFTARLPATLPRVLELEWNGCATHTDIYTRAFSGPGEIALYGDDFRPAAVAGIRLGTPLRDHVEVLDSLNFPLTVPLRHVRNLRLSGHIALSRLNEDVERFRGPFAYVLTGFYYEELFREIEAPKEEWPKSIFWWSAEGAHISGKYDFGPGGRVWDELRIAAGRFYFQFDSESSPGVMGSTENHSITADDLHIKNNFDDWYGTTTYSIDGRLSVVWPERMRMNCDCENVYSYHTEVPLRRPVIFGSSTYVFEAGKLNINGSATATFSMVANPAPFPLHVDVDANGVGQFGYDMSFRGFDELAEAAACPTN